MLHCLIRCVLGYWLGDNQINKNRVLCCKTAHALNMWVSERTDVVLLVVAVFPVNEIFLIGSFFCNTAGCYSMGFSFRVCFAKKYHKKVYENSGATCLLRHWRYYFILCPCACPWQKSILFSSFACSTFLKVKKETKIEINVIITLNSCSTNEAWSMKGCYTGV